MTDLWMMKLCREAMGHRTMLKNGALHCADTGHLVSYDPLHDDAQAMALVKKFQLEQVPPQCRSDKQWRVSSYSNGHDPVHTVNSDLNRAIVECVAKMQSEKK